MLHLLDLKGNMRVGTVAHCCPFTLLPQSPVPTPLLFITVCISPYAHHSPLQLYCCLSNTGIGSAPELQRHTIPLIPVTGHRDVLQSMAHFLHEFVGSVHMIIHRVAKFIHNQSLSMNDVGDETLCPVIRHSACHSHFSSLVHQSPGYRGPFRSQET